MLGHSVVLRGESHPWEPDCFLLPEESQGIPANNAYLRQARFAAQPINKHGLNHTNSIECYGIGKWTLTALPANSSEKKKKNNIPEAAAIDGLLNIAFRVGQQNWQRSVCICRSVFQRSPCMRLSMPGRAEGAACGLGIRRHPTRS
jgi:hypothetical protein